MCLGRYRSSGVRFPGSGPQSAKTDRFIDEVLKSVVEAGPFEQHHRRRHQPDVGPKKALKHTATR